MCGPGTESLRSDHRSSIYCEMRMAVWLRQYPRSRLLGSNEQACFWDFSFLSLNVYIFTITVAIHLYTHWMSWHKAFRKIPTYNKQVPQNINALIFHNLTVMLENPLSSLRHSVLCWWGTSGNGDKEAKMHDGGLPWMAHTVEVFLSLSWY